MPSLSKKAIARLGKAMRRVESMPADGKGIGMTLQKWPPFACKVAVNFGGGNAYRLWHIVDGGLTEGEDDEIVSAINLSGDPIASGTTVILGMVDMHWVVIWQECEEA
jgi:hypothetical protein